jgi:hypothetical protein
MSSHPYPFPTLRRHNITLLITHTPILYEPIYFYVLQLVTNKLLSCRYIIVALKSLCPEHNKYKQFFLYTCTGSIFNVSHWVYHRITHLYLYVGI